MVKRAWTKDDMSVVLTGAMKRALTAVGMVLETAAAREAPVGQYPKGSGRVGGRLKGSITYATKQTRSHPSNAQNKPNDGVSAPTDDLTVHIGTNVEYAPYVEYGTRYMRARPTARGYLRRAFDLNKGICKKLFAEQLAAGLKSGKR